jgi:hypothetical protein
MTTTGEREAGASRMHSQRGRWEQEQMLRLLSTLRATTLLQIHSQLKILNQVQDDDLIG